MTLLAGGRGTPVFSQGWPVRMDVSNLAEQPLVFISAAEPSADVHGASLIRAARSKCPEIRFVGVAGQQMVKAGCEPIYDMSRHSGMLLGAIKAAGRAVAMLRTADNHLRRYRFSAAVVIDSPTLHLPLAARAQAANVPVLYYIAPQMWAWGAYRIHKLRNRTDRVAVILPFEEKYFRDQGVDAVYVGHPLADRLAEAPIDQEVVARLRLGGSPVVAMLPGSRRHVVAEVLKGQIEVGERITHSFPRAKLVVSVANEQVRDIVDGHLSKRPTAVETFFGAPAPLIAAADLVLVASGTSALEVAFHLKPMVVMYNSSRLFYQLVGRWMIHTRYLCLPNILAGREIVPEFMPYYSSTEPIAERAIELLESEEARDRMIEDLSAVVAPMRETHASDRTADLLLDLIRRSGH